jgi:hypothetical protein
MRTLTGTLIAAQKAASRTPYVKVEARNNLCGVVNLKWARLYTGSEPDGPHALTIPGDGSLIRLRATPSGDNRKLYRQRVVDPGPASDYSAWTYLNIYGVTAVAACSLGTEVSLFWVKNTGEINSQKSLDNGATWAAADYPGYAPTGAVAQMAGAYKPNGDLALFFTDTSALYVIKCISGVWQARTVWNKTTGTLSGAAAVYDRDWKLLVSGQDSAGARKLWSLIYGDGGEVAAGNWSALKEINTAPSDSGLEFNHVFMDKTDVFRFFCNEKYTGSEAYNRPYWSHSLSGTEYLDNRWREPAPFDTEVINGLAAAHTSSCCWLSTPSGIWRAALAAVILDLSADVSMLKHTALTDAGKVEIELRNDLGQYATLPAPLDTGCQIDISPGCRTNAGSEYSPGLTFTLQAFEYRSGSSKSTLLLEARDGWRWVKNWIARYQFRWNPATDDAAVSEILAQVLARCGIKLTILSSSATAGGFYPDFTIHPGEDGTDVIVRLLSFIPDVLYLEGSTAFLINPLAADASTYAYGTDHAIFEARFRTGAYTVNRTRVEGLAVMGEDFNWPEIEKNGDILQIVEDLNADTVARAHERGEAVLRKREIEAGGGNIRVPVNCGQQLYDVVEITDVVAGFSATRRRVLGLVLAYQPAKGIYEHQLIIGNV